MADSIVVDAHHHLWDLSAHYYPWLTDRQNPGLDVKPFARDYGVRDYLSDASGVSLLKSVHVQAGYDPADPVGETRWLSAVAERDGFPHAIVAQADLSRDDAKVVLAAHAAYPLTRGIRMLLTWHPDAALRRAARADYLCDKSWLRGLSAMTDLGLSFDMQIYPLQMEAAAKVVGAFPSTTFIIDHLGLPLTPLAFGHGPWADGLRRLAAFGNVAIKLSGFSHFMRAWSREDVGLYVGFALDTFGQERCLFGSNFPVDRPIVSYARMVADMAAVLRVRGESVAADVLGRNALRWYRID